ncbi:VWA domain-containing protein [Actinoplanes sp. KI2]|uniref:vWA domain-containing protein n=1 Tax=Actinoplanes sp. KI2 TaxID=2983315 RepID=UPI0021D5F857|nr:VWA domain-containing protein [Actinoplanes sp. KI2]MCU7726510.1 VWA domain-containing protein [Actinoplanes sp. KI2]
MTVERGGAPAPLLLRGADRAAFVVAFVERLRSAGVGAGLTETDDFVRALGVSPPTSRETLYWTARIALLRRQEDLIPFDRVFSAVFDDTPPLPLTRAAERAARQGEANVPVRGGGDRSTVHGGGLPWATLPAAGAVDETESGQDQLRLPELRASGLAALAERPFEELDAGQTALLGEALKQALTRWPTRRSRRHAADPAGRRVALRPTIAGARRTGWEAVTIVRERPVRRPRRVVMLCDVSESMRPQAAAYLQLMRAFATVGEAEVFAFATTLTRLTPALRQSSARAAIEQATTAVGDRFGGTRIASNLTALLDSHHGNALRGAIAVVASDGWDSEPAERMTMAMRRLRRRAYAIMWLNPRAGAPGFRPDVAAMAAAAPFCDALLPAATFADLIEVVHRVGDPASAVGPRGTSLRGA